MARRRGARYARAAARSVRGLSYAQVLMRRYALRRFFRDIQTAIIHAF